MELRFVVVVRRVVCSSVALVRIETGNLRPPARQNMPLECSTVRVMSCKNIHTRHPYFDIHL